MIAAKGAEKFHTTANNSARTETIEEAAEIDDKFISKWIGHPYFRVIDNSTDFEDKMKRLIAEIELSDENIAIEFPKEIKVIKEVTDESYKNSSLAKIIL